MNFHRIPLFAGFVKPFTVRVNFDASSEHKRARPDFPFCTRRGPVLKYEGTFKKEEVDYFDAERESLHIDALRNVKKSRQSNIIQ